MTKPFTANHVQRCDSIKLESASVDSSPDNSSGPGSTGADSVGADRRDGRVYVYHDPDIQLAINVALITGRPLLIEGPSGCGKSALAFNVALTLNRKYYEFVVTNRSQSQDLLWSMDNIRRLNDASAERLKADQAYVEPGVLWWAFDACSATHRGKSGVVSSAEHAVDPNRGCDGTQAVILIDEIDKADPDMPNGLLVPLGSQQFAIPATRFTVTASASPLIIITTNNERELPPAFLRRCVLLRLSAPRMETLVEIALEVDADKGYQTDFLTNIAKMVLRIDDRGEAPQVCSTAEYLDTVRACHELEIQPDDEEFQRLTRITLRKSGNNEEPSRWV